MNMSRSSTGLLSGLQIYGMLTLATYSANQGANMIIDGLIDGNKVHGFHHLLSKYYSYRSHHHQVYQTCNMQALFGEDSILRIETRKRRIFA